MKRTLFLVAATLVLYSAAVAQTTFATITGLVTDPNGAVITRALVNATQIESNYSYTARSNDTGYFTIGQLLEGLYVLRAVSIYGLRSAPLKLLWK